MPNSYFRGHRTVTREFFIGGGLCVSIGRGFRPVKRSYSFSPQWCRNSGEFKIFPPKVKGSPMHLVSVEYHGLLKRLAGRSNQGRNDGGQEGKIPRVRIATKAPNDCGGCRKVLTRSQVLQCICFWKTSGLYMGAPNLLLAPDKWSYFFELIEYVQCIFVTLRQVVC